MNAQFQAEVAVLHLILDPGLTPTDREVLERASRAARVVLHDVQVAPGERARRACRDAFHRLEQHHDTLVVVPDEGDAKFYDDVDVLWTTVERDRDGAARLTARPIYSLRPEPRRIDDDGRPLVVDPRLAADVNADRALVHRGGRASLLHLHSLAAEAEQVGALPTFPLAEVLRFRNALQASELDEAGWTELLTAPDVVSAVEALARKHAHRGRALVWAHGSALHRIGADDDEVVRLATQTFPVDVPAAVLALRAHCKALLDELNPRSSEPPSALGFDLGRLAGECGIVVGEGRLLEALMRQGRRPPRVDLETVEYTTGGDSIGARLRVEPLLRRPLRATGQAVALAVTLEHCARGPWLASAEQGALTSFVVDLGRGYLVEAQIRRFPASPASTLRVVPAGPAGLRAPLAIHPVIGGLTAEVDGGDFQLLLRPFTARRWVGSGAA